MVLWARVGGALLGLVLLLAPLAASGAETPVLNLKQLTVMALQLQPRGQSHQERSDPGARAEK